MYKNYKDFDYNKFAKEFAYGDLCGLEYLEQTIIKDMKEKIKEDNIKFLEHFTIEEYITSLFYATMKLNNCNNIYETESKVKTNFNFDIYANVRNKLFEELGFDLEKLSEDIDTFLIKGEI